ncbi:permease-like cell division protein FtsX [Streptosporangium saharense]|uniref:permease-like cell division protein FtsX n=1 Tax=Streptosporangium saharense TaxID=1706840 RepID=UPI003673D677
MTETENRLRDALSAAASTAVDIRPLTAPVPRRRRWTVPIAATAAAAFVAVLLTVRLASVLASSDGSEVIAMSVGTQGESGTPGIRVFLCASGDTALYSGCADGKVTEEGKADVQAALQNRSEVESVFFTDQRTAYEDFRRTYNDKNPELLQVVKITDMSDSFTIQVRPGADRTALLEAVSKLPGVTQAADIACLVERTSLRSIVIRMFFGDDEPCVRWQSGAGKPGFGSPQGRS